MATEKILITGAFGQLGSELSVALGEIYGNDKIIISDIRAENDPTENDFTYESLDVQDAFRLGEIIKKHQITQIYHLAAILSANAEKNPLLAWNINMQGTLNVFRVALDQQIQKVYFPSSIAAFGPDTPAQNTPQHSPMNPNTVYGISKLSGELWGNYYFERYGLDVRSLRYPGIISYKTLPGGGTTDYAVDIFHQALTQKSYTCFLQKDTYLPMMYMPDAIRATLELMHAEASTIKIRTGYNLAAMSFSPEEIYKEICKHIPEFQITYHPDFRQKIADSWPQSIDDSQARGDWGWFPAYTLPSMVEDMLIHLRERLQTPAYSYLTA
ncbi:MAG: NAD-dependent epimerase/dehydratase family protein [Microscillaceae bacterium]|nr:NAD-dependent epimerase/dehydratase family protein [Microscillaceae bacterium]